MAKYTAQQIRDLYAKGQALTDHSFPIADKQDLANAILTIGLADNPGLAKAFIIKRAREMNDLSMLPKAWNVTK